MPTDIVIPTIGESVTSGVVSRWLKPDGAAVARDEAVLELETDKVTMEVPAPVAGVLRHNAKQGDTVAVGAVVGSVAEGAAAPAAVSAPAAKPTPAQAVAQSAAPSKPAPSAVAVAEVRATPLARKTAADLGVELTKLEGTGPGGRIREQDVVQAARPASAAPAPSTNGTPKPAVASGSRNSTRERVTPIRQRIAQRLVQAQHNAAMLTTFNEVDMGPVMDLRKSFKEEFEKKHGIGLGFMGFFVKAATAALQAFPMVNAYLIEENGQMLVEKHDFCDVSVAISTPKGLIVPVLRDTQNMSIAGVEAGIKDLATRGRDGKVTLDEMAGGTFTITNGGVFGSLMSTPILNPPQSAILGMHAIKNRAVEYPVGSGQVAIRPMMYLALSYDHRIIDGAEAVQFLVRIKQAIEDPHRLLLNL
jgi:2-oxoglutarate dehydrogenase E2 component (dihydrolipoamide succinyltransferase)